MWVTYILRTQLGDDHLILRGGLALYGNEYSDLQNAENNLSSFCWENKYFPSMGGGEEAGGGVPIFPKIFG